MATQVRISNSVTVGGTFYKVGQVVVVADSLARSLISAGYAVLDTGDPDPGDPPPPEDPENPYLTATTGDARYYTKGQSDLAAANASTADRARSNHTGQQSSASISDWSEAVQDAVAQFLGVTGAGITKSYDDASGILTLSVSASGDPETLRDVIGAAMLGVGYITVAVNDTADTITVSTTATQNAPDAALRDRATHTGTQSADSLVDGTNVKAFTSAERTKLAGVNTGATANSTDAALRDRTTHTGVQPSTTISDFQEAVQDAVAALLASGTNVTLAYNDAGNTLTVTASGGDAEAMRDTIGAALVGVGVVSVVVNDATDTITITSTATANATDAALRDRATHTGTQAISTVAGLQAALDAKATVTAGAQGPKRVVQASGVYPSTASIDRDYYYVIFLGPLDPYTNADAQPGDEHEKTTAEVA